MASIWCCDADVTLKEPMNVPGYPKSTRITVWVKVRSESEKEPSDKSIIDAAGRLMDRCYSDVVLSIQNPVIRFLLWEHV